VGLEGRRPGSGARQWKTKDQAGRNKRGVGSVEKKKKAKKKVKSNFVSKRQQKSENLEENAGVHRKGSQIYVQKAIRKRN